MRIQHVRHPQAYRAPTPEVRLPVTDRLAGRANVETNAGFARLDRDPVCDPAVRVSESMAADFLVEPSADRARQSGLQS